jgi:hypothetical protein
MLNTRFKTKPQVPSNAKNSLSFLFPLRWVLCFMEFARDSSSRKLIERGYPRFSSRS